MKDILIVTDEGRSRFAGEIMKDYRGGVITVDHSVIDGVNTTVTFNWDKVVCISEYEITDE
ncbi:hypothetical protein SEA_STEPHIG9_46 [Mycobacterium phage Stephig9]|uniref:Uncharacterized protein n=1 Tax=Mycobacterium phage Stephig9 TaxID=2591224 RepID=A0A514DHB7_9CAUD|nr:hypothetical protein SEA_STEPHIG9_46 [Mycobacterium phage Stephig9]